MEDTVKKLEAMFNKAESEIDYVTRKVDVECANVTEGSTNVNPAELIKRLKDIKKDYADIVKETQAIQQAEQEAANFFKEQLTGLCSTLTKLQQQTNLPQQSDTAPELQQLESLLGVTLTSGVVFPDGVAPDTCPCTPPQTSSHSNHTAQSEQPTASVCELSAHDRRAHSTELIELDEQEFMSVSSLVRGKVKLSDVNQTYRVLWQHFKDEGHSNSLSPADMYKMGLRVTGQTGEAKLKVLRALKLLTLSRNGDVSLV